MGKTFTIGLNVLIISQWKVIYLKPHKSEDQPIRESLSREM